MKTHHQVLQYLAVWQQIIYLKIWFDCQVYPLHKKILYRWGNCVNENKKALIIPSSFNILPIQEDCELVQFQFLLVPEDPASLRQESHLILLNIQNKMILMITNPASSILHILKGKSFDHLPYIYIFYVHG